MLAQISLQEDSSNAQEGLTAATCTCLLQAIPAYDKSAVLYWFM
jgi:hypothetical protein